MAANRVTNNTFIKSDQDEWYEKHEAAALLNIDIPEFEKWEQRGVISPAKSLMSGLHLYSRNELLSLTSEMLHHVETIQQCGIGIRRLHILKNISRKLFDNLDTIEAIDIVCLELLNTMHFMAATISIYEPEIESLITLKELDHRNRSFSNDTYPLSQYPATAAVIKKQEPIVVNLSDESADINERHFLKKNNFVCLLMMPLVFQGKTIGVVELWDDIHERFFNHDELGFAHELSDIVAISVHNAIFVEQLRRQNEEHRLLFGTAEILGKSLSYHDSLMKITKRLVEVFDVANACFYSCDLDNNEFLILADYFHPDVEDNSSDMGTRYNMADWTNIRECIVEKRPVTSALDDPDLPEKTRAAMLEYNEKSSLAVPVIYQNNVLGVLEIIESRRIIRFSEAEKNLAQTIANYTGIVLNNISLYEDRGKANRNLATILKAAETVTASVDKKRVLNNLAIELSEALNISNVEIYEYDKNKHFFEKLAFSMDIHPDDLQQDYKAGEIPEFDACIASKAPVITYIDDPKISDKSLLEMERWNEKATLVVPIVFRGRTIGIANLAESKYIRRFSEDDIRLAAGIAAHGAIAIENARVYDNEQKERKRLVSINSRLNTLVEMSDQLHGLMSETELLSQIGRAINETMGYKQWAVYFNEKKQNRLRMAGPFKSANKLPDTLPETYVPEKFIIGIIKDALPISGSFLKKYHPNKIGESDMNYLPYAVDTQNLESFVEKDILLVPMKGDRGKHLGYLGLADPDTKKRPSAAHVKILEIFSAKAATSFQMSWMYENMEKQAITDGLTGLYNHRHLQERLAEEVVRANRYNTPLSIIMIDIDNFKLFNDTYGHPKGDKVLKGIAGLLQASTRDKVDLAARYGGEEFFIMLPNTPLKEASLIAERIRINTMDSRFEGYTNKHDVQVTLSIGIAEFPNHADSAKELISRCDEALYRAKHSGKNRVSVFMKA